jgi:diguanylate cyclase (GGDEF)-like protein
MSEHGGLPRILVVDDSRIVRAAIIKRIRDRFDVREEADGEAGWEAILIDPTIRLVITDQSMPRLDGLGLIERIRASKLTRIREMPVIMISGDEDETSRQRAKDLGATDFITKGTGTAELLARLDSLVSLTRIYEALDMARAEAAIDFETGLLAPAVLIRQTEQALSFAHRHGSHVGVLMIGIDNCAELVEIHRQEQVDGLIKRLAAALAGSVRREDSLARWGSDRFAIVTPGISPGQTHLFGQRLYQAMASARGHDAVSDMGATVTIGLASFPADGEMSAATLLAAAERRMDEGMANGGDQVAAGDLPAVDRHPSVDSVLAQLAAGRVAAVLPHLPALGLKVLPLLNLMDKQFALGLPLTDILRRLAANEKEERFPTTENKLGVL